MAKLAIASITLSCLALAGCASLGSSPGPSPSALEAYEKNPALPNAVAVAESLRDNYRGRASAQRRDERLAGLGLIGMGLVAGDLAIRGIAKSEVLGLGLAGMGVYTANNWSNPKAERLAFVEGAAAVQCALNAVDPLRVAYFRRSDLVRVIGELEESPPRLASELKSFAGVQSKNAVRARHAVSRAVALRPDARAALARLDGAGGQLNLAIGAIQVAVERGLEAASPDFRALVASLTDQKILGPSPLLAPAGTAKTSGDDEALAAPTDTLEATIAEAESIIALVNAKPAAGGLQDCKLDLAAAGITMKVNPAAVTVQAGTTKAALVTGGVPAYTVSWRSTAPPSDQVSLTVDPNGIISIEAKANAAAATYAVLVADNAKGRESLAVTVTAANAPDTAGAGDTPAESAAAAAAEADCVPVPKVKAVQQALAGMKIDPGKLDGCMGATTIAAMKRFWREKQHAPKNTIDTDPGMLLKNTALALKIKE